MSGDDRPATLAELEREITVVTARLEELTAARMRSVIPGGPSGVERELAERLSALRDQVPVAVLAEAARALSRPTPGELAGLRLAALAGESPQPNALGELFKEPEWILIAEAYRALPPGRPSQAHLAEKLYEDEDTLRQRLRRLGVPDYRRIHALMAAYNRANPEVVPRKPGPA